MKTQLALAALLSVPALALAAPVQVGAYAGLYVYDDVRDLTSSDVASAPENAPLFGVRGSVAPTWLLTRIEGSADLLLGELADGSSLTNLALRLEVLHPFTEGTLRPYLAMGPALQLGFTDDGTDADIAFTAGGGLDLDLAADWGLRFDVHWVAGDGVASVANDFMFSLGASYAFGSP